MLSALHGLLAAEAPIKDYDLKLTPARADELVLDPAHLARSLGSLRCNAEGVSRSALWAMCFTSKPAGG